MTDNSETQTAQWNKYNRPNHCTWSVWGKYESDILSPILVSQ